MSGTCRSMLLFGLASAAVAVAGCIGEGGSPSLVDGIDRVVVRHESGLPAVEYTDPATVAAIVSAIENAREDDGVYDTPVGTYVIECYVGPDLVHEMPECSGLFRVGSQQYRDSSGALQQYVDDALAP